MKATSASQGPPPAGGQESHHRRVPPIGSGDLDDLSLLRFEVLDALAVAEAVLHQTRALDDWLRSLPDRLDAATFSTPALRMGVGAVAGVRLPTRSVELLLLSLDELHGHLDAAPAVQVPQVAQS